VTPRQSWWSRLAVVFVIVALVAAFYLTGLDELVTLSRIKANLTDLQARTDANLGLAVVLFVTVYVVVTGLSLPVSVWLAVLAGALFGRWLGFGVASVSSTLGATLAMLTSRYLLRDWVQRRFGHRYAGYRGHFERDGAYYLVSLRLLPAVPYWLVNLLMGLTPIRTVTFLLASWLGMMPITFLYVNAGTELSKVESPQDVLSANVVIALILLACLPLAVKGMARRWATKTIDPEISQIRQISKPKT
jgi:uncharacterized membrane protein YdjX (TVP38/TMEM64 family)